MLSLDNLLLPPSMIIEGEDSWYAVWPLRRIESNYQESYLLERMKLMLPEAELCYLHSQEAITGELVGDQSKVCLYTFADLALSLSVPPQLRKAVHLAFGLSRIKLLRRLQQAGLSRGATYCLEEALEMRRSARAPYPICLLNQLPHNRLAGSGAWLSACLAEIQASYDEYRNCSFGYRIAGDRLSLVVVRAYHPWASGVLWVRSLDALRKEIAAMGLTDTNSRDARFLHLSISNLERAGYMLPLRKGCL